MKKIALLLVLTLLLSCLTGCSGKTDAQTTVPLESETKDEIVTISVNKNLVADETVFLTEISEFDGITVSNKDVFYVLTMSQETYVSFLKSKAQSVYDNFDAIVEQGSFVEKIEHNEDFRKITVLVERDGFDAITKETQRLQLITIGAYAMSYQMFLTEGQKTSVVAVYSDTNEEAMLITLPISM